MKVMEIISFAITIVGFIIGIITAVAKLAVCLGKMKQRLETDEENAK